MNPDGQGTDRGLEEGLKYFREALLAGVAPGRVLIEVNDVPVAVRRMSTRLGLDVENGNSFRIVRLVNADEAPARQELAGESSEDPHDALFRPLRRP